MSTTAPDPVCEHCGLRRGQEMACRACGVLTLAGGEELTFTDGIDFARQLASSDRVRNCYVLHWTRYALGNQIEGTMPALAPLQARFRENDSIKDLLVSIAGSDLFRGPTAGVVSGDHR